MQKIKIGDIIPVHACKADGATYRNWTAVVEWASDDLIVTIGQAGSHVFNADGGIFHIERHLRAYYWFDRYYNLIEVFELGGTLLEIYINVASPPEFKNGVLRFKDHELDVSKVLPHPAKLVDEDEFAQAVLKYNYSSEFQDKMYAASREALELAENWDAKPCPVFE